MNDGVNILERKKIFFWRNVFVEMKKCFVLFFMKIYSSGTENSSVTQLSYS